MPENCTRLMTDNLIVRRLQNICYSRSQQTRPTLTEIKHRDTDAVATITDAIAYGEFTERMGCILPLQFTPAFDRLAHQYLYFSIDQHGFCKNVLNLIRTLYGGAQPKVYINRDQGTPQSSVKRTVYIALRNSIKNRYHKTPIRTQVKYPIQNLNKICGNISVQTCLDGRQWNCVRLKQLWLFLVVLTIRAT
jgi:hypothetical protein